MNKLRWVKNKLKKILKYFPLKQKRRKKNAERLIPEFYQQNDAEKILFLKHQFAYEFAKKYIQPPMLILDYGCGDGYGAKILAQTFSEVQVIGCDVDIYTVKQARKKYNLQNVKYLTLNELKKAFLKFDLIVSFQVIEHIENVNSYLCFLKEMLSDNGTLIISTPSRNYRLNENQPPWNPYHLREYSMAQFKEEIEKVFKNTCFYSLTAIPEVLKIEFSRVAAGREDKKIFNNIQIQHNAYHKDYSIDNFWLTKENPDDGLDLFCVFIKSN